MPQGIKRTVKRVIDGDTFELDRKIKGSRFVRLANINAPELNERGGRAAFNRLKRKIEGKQITIVPKGRSYGRVVADVRYKKKAIKRLFFSNCFIIMVIIYIL